MKRSIFPIMVLTVLMNTACTREANPLLEPFNTPHGTPPFEKIKFEHWKPAFEEGLRQSREEIDAIANNPDAPTFQNTVEALERQGELLERTAGLFFALNESNTSREMEELAGEIIPQLTELSNYVSLNPLMFQRVKTVYDQTYATGQYDTEQRKLLENLYKRFVRSGALLGPEDQERYREITTELSQLTLNFGINTLAATNAYSFNIPETDAAKVEYMPDFVLSAMAEEAASRGEQGWTVTLQAPSYIPFMMYSRERDIKEQLWRTYGSLSYGGENDNRDNVKRITELRLQLANLLGYETYADYVLEERMAENRPTVDNFLDELLVKTKAWAVEDFNDIKNYALAQPEAPAELMPWDFMYYDELYKTEKYALSDELVKPYFQLENVEKGTFMLAEKLFGITFRENSAIQVYHPDVRAYEVYDEDGSFLSVLYMDYFPRESKRGGAWMTNFRDMYTTADGVEVRPFVTLNFNFTKPTADTPSLLTFDELTVVLHEFGHGLHGMLTKGRYASLTGTSVYGDFVELPSQLLENWATEKEFLDLWAVHYQTGEKIPEELIGKIIAAKNYLAAYGNVGQLRYGMGDMAWHSITSPVTIDVAAFEKNATARTQILPRVEGTCFSTGFGHIFAGGYAAGYYGYKWAEVLEADAFSLFQEKGIFNREVADSYRRNILEKGGTEHPMVLYQRFRGHKPETQALIDKIGEGR